MDNNYISDILLPKPWTILEVVANKQLIYYKDLKTYKSDSSLNLLLISYLLYKKVLKMY